MPAVADAGMRCMLVLLLLLLLLFIASNLQLSWGHVCSAHRHERYDCRER